jgi:hypothetical protein
MLHIGVSNNEYECEFALKGIAGMRLCHLRSGNKNNTGQRPLERTERKWTCKLSPKSCMLSGVHDNCWSDDLLLAFARCDTLVSWNPVQLAAPITLCSAQLVLLYIYILHTEEFTTALLHAENVKHLFWYNCVLPGDGPIRIETRSSRCVVIVLWF